jgi:acyl-CoA dehydrogenase
MVSFHPTEDQQMLVDTIRRFAASDVQPAAHEQDEASTPDAGLIDAGWQLGLIPTALPEAYGGLGEMSAVTGVLAAEELAFGDLALAMHVLAPALFAYPVALFGSDAQKETWLARFADEAFYPATAALLEPSIIFDEAAMTTTAEPAGDAVVLRGEKAYVPLADRAEAFLVYAHNARSDAIEAYIVERDAPGLTVGVREQLMGLRALPQFRLALDHVRVTRDAQVMIDYGVLRARSQVALAAMAVGVARASYTYALAYAKERVQFGKPIAQNQAIAFMLANMAVDIDAARLMVWEAAWMLDEGQDATREAYLAKEFADAMVLEVTDSGVQTLGGYGFIREYPAERWLRNGRGFPTFTGLAMV